MGKRVIPEVIEFYCDMCGVDLIKGNENDFVFQTKEVLRDFSGSAMNDHVEKYQLCSACTKKVKNFINENTDTGEEID